MRIPDRAMLAALLVAAAVLRFGALGREDLWLDEAQSALVASTSFREIAEIESRDNKPPLYYYGLRVWMVAFGNGEVAVRSLSAAAGVVAVAVVWLLGAPMLSPRTARVAATILTFHPLAIHYSREARNYSLLLLLVLIAMLMLARALESGPRWSWAAYSVSLGCAFLVHYITALVLPIFALQLAVSRWRENWKRWTGWSAFAFAPLLAWAPLARRQPGVVASSLSWFEPFWSSWSPLDPFARSFVLFVPGGSAPPWVGLPASPAIQWLVLLSGLAALACFFFHLEPDSNRVVIGGALLVPLALLWLGSFATFPMYLVGRADYVAFPGAIFLLATSIARARTRLASSAIALLLASSTIAGLVVYWRTPPANTESLALRSFASALEPGDAVVCTGLVRPTAEYAIVRAGTRSVRIASFPMEMSLHPAVYDPRPWSAEALEAEADAIDDILRETKRKQGRAYLLLIGDEATSVLGGMLRSKWSTRHVASYRLKRVGQHVEIVEAVSRHNP